MVNSEVIVCTYSCDFIKNRQNVRFIKSNFSKINIPIYEHVPDIRMTVIIVVIFTLIYLTRISEFTEQMYFLYA